jgi:hypothetical protein
MKFVSLRPNMNRLFAFFLGTIIPTSTTLCGELATQQRDQCDQSLIKHASDITHLLEKINYSIQELFNDKSPTHLRVHIASLNNVLVEINTMQKGIAQYQDQSAQCVREILSKLDDFVRQLHCVLERYEYSDNYIALAKELELFVANLVNHNFRCSLEDSITTLYGLVAQHDLQAAAILKKTAYDLLQGNPLYATVNKWVVLQVLQKRLRK